MVLLQDYRFFLAYEMVTKNALVCERDEILAKLTRATEGT